MIEYKYKKRENKFTENGHTMFEFDVLQRLKRLAYLEEQMKQGQLLPIDSVSQRSELLIDFMNKTQGNLIWGWNVGGGEKLADEYLKGNL